VIGLLLCMPGAARADDGEDAIRDVIARWYAELAKKDEGRLWGITAPGFIDSSPHYRYVDNGSAALGPRVYTSLAATALQFAYDIDGMRVDPNFARVAVWERGYFYAFAVEKTYELAASTTFVLERQKDSGEWLILAHQATSIGIPSNKITDPMPDMRERYLETLPQE